jgi:hypothetical protein
MVPAYTIEWFVSSAWVNISNYLVGEDAVQTSHTTTGDRSGFAFGDDSESTATFKVRRAIGRPLRLQPVRITYTMDSTTRRAFTGIVKTTSGDRDIITVDCTGFKRLIEKTKAYTNMVYRRPVATATSTVSVEDPSSGSCVSGLINQLLWTSGGRPKEQDFNSTYVSQALFWYSCEQAVIAPDWTWTAGDDAWSEIMKLCQASGGQLYQDGDGIVRYKQPFSFADGTAVFVFDATATTHNPAVSTPHGDFEETYPDDQAATKITCSYVPRRLEAIQNVVEDTDVRMVNAGDNLTIDLEPKFPIRSLVTNGSGLKDDALNVTFFNGAGVAQVNPGGYQTYVVVSAQKISLVIGNYSSFPFYVNKITLQGEPVVAGEAGTVSVGSGTEEMTISENTYIQSRSHAQRLCEISQLFYSQERAVRVLRNVPYMPERFIGESVRLNIPDIGISSVAHVIVAIEEGETGIDASYTLVSTAGLPKTSDYFLIGTAYSGLTRKLGY